MFSFKTSEGQPATQEGKTEEEIKEHENQKIFSKLLQLHFFFVSLYHTHDFIQGPY